LSIRFSTPTRRGLWASRKAPWSSRSIVGHAVLDIRCARTTFEISNRRSPATGFACRTANWCARR
jgi:hypothetical protein